MDEVASPDLENTPRFTIGHLCIATALTVWWLQHADDSDVEITLELPAGYEDLFRHTGPGDRRLPERGVNPPSKECLLSEFRRQHGRLEQTLQDTPDELFGITHTWYLSHHLPRTADIVIFSLLHEMLHLGQLAAWRSAMGLPAAMARMAELRP